MTSWKWNAVGKLLIAVVLAMDFLDGGQQGTEVILFDVAGNERADVQAAGASSSEQVTPRAAG